MEDLFLGSQWSIILGYRRLSVKFPEEIAVFPFLFLYFLSSLARFYSFARALKGKGIKNSGQVEEEKGKGNTALYERIVGLLPVGFFHLLFFLSFTPPSPILFREVKGKRKKAK